MPSSLLNPYRSFQHLKPVASIDYGVFVYKGTFAVPQAAALSRAQHVGQLLQQHHPNQALALAREAVQIDPTDLSAQSALANAALATHHTNEARTALHAAIQAAMQLSPAARKGYLANLQSQLSKLPLPAATQ
jgi:Flp pilus assembly protein TadD